MYTFDRAQLLNDRGDDLGMLLSPSPVPDLIECGENNAVWLRVRRSTKTAELTSKQTGLLVTKVLVKDLARDPALYGVTPAQLGACVAALTMRKSDGTV